VAILTETVRRGRAPRRRTFELNATEQANVKLALRVLRKRLGGWEVLARKLGCTSDALTHAAGDGVGKASRPSIGLAVRVAQAAGIAAEDMLSGAWLKDVPCPVCGRKG
jgi:hypothetical protein